jgi:hypothetical protein
VLDPFVVDFDSNVIHYTLTGEDSDGWIRWSQLSMLFFLSKSIWWAFTYAISISLLIGFTTCFILYTMRQDILLSRHTSGNKHACNKEISDVSS